VNLSYGEDDILKVGTTETFDFSKIDYVLSSAGSKVAKEFAPRAVQNGCVVIDNSSAFRMDKDVPLVIPEVNPEDISLAQQSKIIAKTNCAMIQLAMALKPLDAVAKIKRVVVSTYQSVSGSGKAGMDELFHQSKGSFMNTKVPAQHFTKPIAFNLIPHIDMFDHDGNTGEETKVMSEFQKVMHRPIPMAVTCVRVPVFIGHSMAVNVEFEDAITVSEAKQALKSAKGVSLTADSENYITPVEVPGEDAVFVSRVRKDTSVPHGLNLWIVADNLRKGAALNAVQILEMLVK
jgi:aspartate-semialdehyde dehydrogenase